MSLQGCEEHVTFTSRTKSKRVGLDDAKDDGHVVAMDVGEDQLAESLGVGCIVQTGKSNKGQLCVDSGAFGDLGCGDHSITSALDRLDSEQHLVVLLCHELSLTKNADICIVLLSQ
ncbi:hypothetical protein PGQ11_006131 [Apiospora arundinis]|uniref:Uncharacterized protein n=1 Tax=Apiospora arundinis TaxID=335852 RepID=A0ABR2IRS5_9PEZI